MYSTIESISKKIEQRLLLQLLNDEVRPEEQIDLSDNDDPVTSRFNDAAEEAKAEIEPYLRGRYKLPFSSVPKLIVAISDSITIYKLYKRRGNIPEDVKDDYLSQVKMLEKIEKGMMDLGINDEPQRISNEIRTNKNESDRVFNKDLLDRM